MARRGGRACVLSILVLALFCLACRAFPNLLLEHITRPLLMALHRLTARVPFPVSEITTFAVGVTALFTLVIALPRAVVRRQIAPLARWLRGVGIAAYSILSLLALTWLPAMLAPADVPPQPDAGPLAWLCGELIDALNASPLAFPEPDEALTLAPQVANLPGCAVKAARYPEWMRADAVSGLFVPPTGEALIDADAPRALIPFTAVHELMHLGGVADEGAANIAAWQRCAEAGGPFADSARLWALRYASGLLRRDDPEAWARLRGNMKDPLAQVFSQCGGEIAPTDAPTALPGFSRVRGDYAALAYWLAGEGVMSPNASPSQWGSTREAGDGAL